MNTIHNPSSGKFAPKGKNYHRSVPWYIGLLILAGAVLAIVALGSHKAGAANRNYAPLDLTKAVVQTKQTSTILTVEEEAQVRAKQTLILKEAEALKQKKLLEAELAAVESQLSHIRKESLSFR